MMRNQAGQFWGLLLPPEPAKRKGGGRPRINSRRGMDGIFYHLRTGCQWKAIPRSLVVGSTGHDYFQAWQKAGVFHRLWHETFLIPACFQLFPLL